ncbi:two-component system, NtrC family, sensor histidine kinase PilS [Methylophilus rhizosphaerae]|uniref:histidine kinase n=1 Tax=Methylophilus rhizosphaerae TaxID=492660 RepID=A0A1G9CIE2_9PROT|nr:ATP-binding protein [Methylophilus rhizosphaerae]SDK51420.1 two-component system, NtrC family, sensor histidine kinase PilS [Methylophilus rhizosphaerae]
MMTAVLSTPLPEKSPDIQHLRLYSLYRLSASGMLLGSQLWPYFRHTFAEPSQVFWALLLFFLYALMVSIDFRRLQSKNGLRLKVQTSVDIVFIVCMMHFLQDNQSGIGLLLIINIIFAGLISDGRFAMFYAAIATIGILLENTLQLLKQNLLGNEYNNYSSAVLLSVSCFATAWLAQTLTTRMQRSEKLATERGQDIEQLARTNALITQQMPNGVLVIDQHQRLRHYNQQACTLLGLEEAYLQRAVHSQSPLNTLIPAIAQLLLTVPANKFTSQDATKFAINNRDLGIRFHAISENIDNGVVIFIEDWSQIQTQAHQVKLAALGRLTANIAHEIRNPLSAISHATQLLQEDNLQPGAERMLQIISDNVQRLDQIIKDVLELNRRDRTNQEQFSINNFLQEFYQQFCAVEKIDISNFTLSVPAKQSTVLFDRRHINQILWNLCKNGWRHCQQQPGSLQLKITSDKSGQFIHILIKDDGHGIAPSIQPHLFEPFMTTEKTGTGLGLFIARELAEANGAKLNYSSSANGTQFSLTIKKVIV